MGWVRGFAPFEVIWLRVVVYAPPSLLYGTAAYDPYVSWDPPAARWKIVPPQYRSQAKRPS